MSRTPSIYYTYDETHSAIRALFWSCLLLRPRYKEHSGTLWGSVMA